MTGKERSKTVVLFNEVGSGSTQDELDVLAQVESVSRELKALGFNPRQIPVSLDLKTATERLQTENPVFIFNLVESIGGSGRFLYFAAALLDQFQIPYSGSGTDALYMTTNKVLSKEWLKFHRIRTPEWFTLNGEAPIPDGFSPPYILKPVWEDASVGLDGASVLQSTEELSRHIQSRSQTPREWFAESYIPGREFNISILAGESGPEVLPLAEIEFLDFPEDKPRIVDYRAKWEVDSFEYQHTVRRFNFPGTDNDLIAELREITLACWRIFNLRGYARVDFRVDDQGRPWVLEINANPCISPDSGFVAAAEQAGLDFKTVVSRIIGDIPQLRRKGAH
jgi:D-alanine-D-alanine ligase